MQYLLVVYEILAMERNATSLRCMRVDAEKMIG